MVLELDMDIGALRMDGWGGGGGGIVGDVEG